MLSVIVPIYNVRPYLRQCIESICDQSYRDLEIILVDDGSCDGSSEICDQYKTMDDRIVVLHKENEGLVKARKSGLQISRGSILPMWTGTTGLSLKCLKGFIVQWQKTMRIS